MRRPLPVEGAGAAELPDGVTVRTYAGGADADAWVALNAFAFADHGEQGRLTRRDFDDRVAQPWFDPAGLFLAERAGRLVGFHWTKVHPTGGELASRPDAGGELASRPDAAGGELASRPDAAGEIYVLGVHPAEQGSGLGRALASIGLSYLASLGLPEVLLYVDAANAPAVRVYERLGFVRTETHVMYGTP
jgi:mycothiol synthase